MNEVQGYKVLASILFFLLIASLIAPPIHKQTSEPKIDYCSCVLHGQVNFIGAGITRADCFGKAHRLAMAEGVPDASACGSSKEIMELYWGK